MKSFREDPGGMSDIELKVKAHGGIAGGAVVRGTEVIIITSDSGSTEAIMRRLIPKNKPIDPSKFHKVVVLKREELE